MELELDCPNVYGTLHYVSETGMRKDEKETAWPAQYE